MSNEEHGQEFLQFVADNEARLKKNLRKNITYNPEIFDDVFQDTIIKVYDRIMKGTVIKDFEQYFFIASKFQYINEDNKVKKRLKVEDREFEPDDDRFAEEAGGWKVKEERNERINELFRFLSDRLNEVFSPRECDIFLIYYRLKSEKAGISYKKLSKIANIDVKEITSIIQKVKNYIKNDKEIIEYKRKILNGNV